MAPSRWLDPQPVSVPEALSAFVGGRRLVAETLVRRGISTVAAARAFLHPEAYAPAPPTDLPDLSRAAARVERALRAGERICVWGDFDVDGQTSTTLLVATLRDLGARVTYHIPVRATESHGITVPYLQQVLDAGAQLILTCDTGVDAHEAIAYANGRGVDVIVTDHHELPATLPEAHAIVNPHRLPEGHPLAHLPGVGVAYQLAAELYRRAGRPRDVEQHLDLVALGIVADVATQRGDTRYLLQRGMEALRNTQRLGLQELMKSAGLHPTQLTTDSIGFGLGPRLNALGRLDDANIIVEFLLTQDVGRARVITAQLEGLNRERQRLCEQVEQEAEARLEVHPQLLEYDALVLASPDWHPGVIGIVASRLVERYHRPAVLLARPDEGPARGSARSVPDCHITDAIATQAHLLLGYGGHAAAAGLALPADRIPEFRRGLSHAVREQRGAEPAPPALPIDGYVTLDELSLELVDDLERLAPFGAGNPPLTLAVRDVTLRNHAPLGRSGDHLQLFVADAEGRAQRVLWWRGAGQPLPEGAFDLAFTARANTYLGQRSLQVTYVDAREELAPVVAVEPAPPTLEVVDYRLEPHPETLLIPYREREDVVVWVDGPAAVAGARRGELGPAAVLVVWNAPPGPRVMEAALAAVQPQEVVLFARETALDEPRAFLERLLGAAKYALGKREGQVDLAALAAALGHREVTVRKGLAWLAARGYFTVARDALEILELAPGAEAAPPAELAGLEEELWALLAETVAYRRHFRRGGEETWAAWNALLKVPGEG